MKRILFLMAVVGLMAAGVTHSSNTQTAPVCALDCTPVDCNPSDCDPSDCSPCIMLDR